MAAFRENSQWVASSCAIDPAIHRQLAQCTGNRAMLHSRDSKDRKEALMHRLALLNGLLVAPPLAGRQAVLLGLGALAVPTLILSTDQSLPAGACCTTYFPFVMMSAIMMSPGYAATVALGSIGLADTLSWDRDTRFSRPLWTDLGICHR
jgi:hypothetical protein